MPTDGDYSKFITSCDQDEIGDLHIGVTNSNSEIYDFDMKGLKKNSFIWLQTPSIFIQLEKHIKIQLDVTIFDSFSKNEWILDKWDLTLESIFKDQKWNSSNYDENFFNCFDFVIEFLMEFGFFGGDVDSKFSDDINKKKIFFKKKLSQNFLETKFHKSLKYLEVLTKLSQEFLFSENFL